MPTKTPSSKSPDKGFDRDVDRILNELPVTGTDDYAFKVMEIYEATERKYRATYQAGSVPVESSSSTNE